MKQEQSLLTFTLEPQTGTSVKARIMVDQQYVASMYREALTKQKRDVRIQGFSQGTTPLKYLEQTYKVPLVAHLQEFFYSNCIVNFLQQQLMQHKVVVIGEPTLVAATLDPDQHTSFTFEMATTSLPFGNELDKISFRPPGRKNYRDLDKQVELFLQEEDRPLSQQSPPLRIGDWVAFTLQPLAADLTPLLGAHQNQLWLKIGDEEADEEAQRLFVGKRVGDSFTTQSRLFQHYVSDSLDTDYTFLTTITHSIDNTAFCLNSFKNHFKLNSPKDMHSKLIEVFSYRNDLSQRRETVEAALKTLLRQYNVTVPTGLVNRHKAAVLELVHQNPDYYVYKAQSNFKETIHLLAEKQLREMAIVDALSYHEQVEVTAEDMLSYINLLKRPRTREFVYFNLPNTKIYGRELPIPHETVRQQCRREKTLNNLIHRLAKK